MRNVGLAEQSVVVARRARELSEQKTEIEREKLRLGVTTNFQLVTFENDLVLAEIAELDALVGHLNATTNLDRTLGTWDPALPTRPASCPPPAMRGTPRWRRSPSWRRASRPAARRATTVTIWWT